ncbi:helix-turn-helix transcriptional regulator [Streptomyces griseocarneus]|uniref:helix-turn-helix transcriptional regulator n=1 Tax=Streptomyces griseocarneus TaxID=51201 RepID=UPI00167CFDD6|nr:helix-turn-helix transcriptional regulator [Streptomyces griseocarneus]MBZ6475304.1 helix-turn-helix transcriptional regulator [Streptomyces griseocarneus]GHG74500.1 transcriptional regulator [Streptomyces griseocarneus]
MNESRELGRALRGWRDRTTPAEAGLPAGGVRRAAGLRREELAQLACLSVDYIVRLEQGRATSPSPQVLSALARALRLSAAEREHLYLLAGQTAPGPGQLSAHIPPGVRRLLDQLDGTPLSVHDAAWNLILWNPLWAALFGDASAQRGRERNVAWRHFTDLPSRVSHTPAQEARFEAAVVADLRAATARYPTDAGLRSLIKDLRDNSTHFAHLWNTGIVGVHDTDTKTVHHPDAGTLTLDCDVLTTPGSDLRIVAYTAAPGSDASTRLRLLSVIGAQPITENNTPVQPPPAPPTMPWPAGRHTHHQRQLADPASG